MLKSEEQFRQYDTKDIRDTVADNYYLNHTQQTVAFVKEKQAQYKQLNHGSYGIWEMLERVNAIVDDSDPDTEFTQLDHVFQTAEATRRANKPDWFVLTGLIHDLGKVLCLYGEPQWAVVGDTFPVGCAYSDKIVFAEFLKDNPDSNIPEYQTKLGIYSENCGLDNVFLSWGHDEYLYYVTKPYLPEAAQYIIRYHSFYPCHRDDEYQYLMNDKDRELFFWVKEFNQFDLYFKAHELPDIDELTLYYQKLIAQYFPSKIVW